jgi:uncharacterized membrane protein YdjX (TVP38/TMEM64 family)
VDPRRDRIPVPRRLPRWTIWFIPALGLVGAYFLIGDELGGWWARFSETMTTPDAFRSWVEGFGPWGPVAFLLAQATQVIVVPIPGTLLPPVGALAFGPWPALGLSLVGLALGSAVVFLVARRWGRPLAVRWAGAERVQRYESVVTARGNLLIWLVFLFPFFPDDAACALAGLSSIRFRRFMLIAIVGRIPAVAFGVFTMAGLEGAPGWVWASAATALVVVLWIGIRFGPALEGLLVRKLGRETTDGTSQTQNGDTPGVSASNESKPSG